MKSDDVSIMTGRSPSVRFRHVAGWGSGEDWGSHAVSHLNGHLGVSIWPCGYPHSWMVFVGENPIKFEMDDDYRGSPYDSGNLNLNSKHPFLVDNGL